MFPGCTGVQKRGLKTGAAAALIRNIKIGGQRLLGKSVHAVLYFKRRLHKKAVTKIAICLLAVKCRLIALLDITLDKQQIHRIYW